MTLLLDVAPAAGGIAVFAAVAFFFLFLAAAFVAYRLLKRSLRMAVRLTIAAALVAFAIAGSIFLYYSSSSTPARPRPPAAR